MKAAVLRDDTSGWSDGGDLMAALSVTGIHFHGIDHVAERRRTIPHSKFCANGNSQTCRFHHLLPISPASAEASGQSFSLKFIGKSGCNRLQLPARGMVKLQRFSVQRDSAAGSTG